MSGNGKDPADRATAEIKFFEREVTRHGERQVIRVLRQLWIMADGATEWRDVPLERIPKKVN